MKRLTQTNNLSEAQFFRQMLLPQRGYVTEPRVAALRGYPGIRRWKVSTPTGLRQFLEQLRRSETDITPLGFSVS